MELLKLLIADECDEFRQALAETLGKTYLVRTCRSGTQALELLQSFRPEVFVTDLMLSHLDGLTVLQQASDSGIHPKVLVVTSHLSPYVQNALERLEVDYLMRKPCDIQAVLSRVSDLAAEAVPQPAQCYDPEDQIAAILLRLGMGPHLDGFRFLLTAVPLFSHDTHQAITKELYVAVAECHGKNPRQVERSIRSAIDGAWRGRNDKVWAGYFTPTPDGQIPRPSNAFFIGRLALVLTSQQEKARIG